MAGQWAGRLVVGRDHNEHTVLFRFPASEPFLLNEKPKMRSRGATVAREACE